MKRNGIYDNWEKRKNFDRYGVKRIRDANQSRVADDVRREKNKNSITYNYNQDDFNKGMQWFDEGLTLDSAPEDLKKNVSFVGGYEKAKRVQFVNELSYKTGIEYYEEGIPFEEIPEMYINNPFFIDGYNFRKDKSLHK